MLFPRCTVGETQGSEFGAGVGRGAVATHTTTPPISRHPGGAGGNGSNPAGRRDQTWQAVCVGGMVLGDSAKLVC